MAKKAAKRREPSNALWVGLTIGSFALLLGIIVWGLVFGRPSGANRFATGPGTGDVDSDVAVAALVNSLTPALKTKLAQGLAHYHASNEQDAGPPIAPHTARTTAMTTTITVWLDVECTGSRELVSALDALARRYPNELVLDLRGAPRGVDCRAEEAERNVRCLAARARVCVAAAASDDGLRFDRTLFAELTTSPARIRAAATEFVPEAALDACLADPRTLARVLTDLELATRARKTGPRTPTVVVAGREASSFSPLLELLVLTRATGRHPALATLPNVAHR